MRGLNQLVSISTRCDVHASDGAIIRAEVVAFDTEHAVMMPYDDLQGLKVGDKVEISHNANMVFPCEDWMGRIISADGQAADGAGLLKQGETPYAIKAYPPSAHERKRVEGKFNLGVKAINTFLTCCMGQRMGIFAGSGVGKSILMSMFARHAVADVNIIALIGERSRELKEFIEDDLGEEGLKRSIIIVATSAEPALMRRQAAYTAMATEEYCRQKRAAHDGLSNKICPSPARNWPSRGRATNHQRIYAQRIF